MKKALITGYIGIALIAGTYSYIFGETRHKSFIYNFGHGITWPVSMFGSTPEIDGDNPNAFNASYEDVFRSSTKYGLSQGVEISTKSLQFYLYAKGNTSVTQADYDALLSDQSRGADVMLAAVAAVNSNPEIQKQFMEYLDGMSAADIFDEREDIEEDIANLLKDRPIAAVSTQILPEETLEPSELTADEVVAAAAKEAKAISDSDLAARSAEIPLFVDCVTPSSKAERIICSDSPLSSAESEVKGAYFDAQACTDDTTLLNTEQLAWNRDTRDACVDKACLHDAYDKRIQKLKSAGCRQ